MSLRKLGLILAAAFAAATSEIADRAAADPCSAVLSNPTYTVALKSSGHTASAKIDFTVTARKCMTRKCPMGGFHHNIDRLIIDGTDHGAFDLVSDCSASGSNAEFALHPLTSTGHLGAIAAEWLFAPTKDPTIYNVNDDFVATPGSTSSLTAGMAGTAEHQHS
jgi:hypothetical protein